MLIPKKSRQLILSYLFKEGVLVAKKDTRSRHPEIDVPNLFVIKSMMSLKSRQFVTETFNWNHYYWYLTNEGIEYLREFLHLPAEIVPATWKKRTVPRTGGASRMGGGDRPSYGKDQGDFKPQFEGRGGFSRGGGFSGRGGGFSSRGRGAGFGTAGSTPGHERDF